VQASIAALAARGDDSALTPGSQEERLEIELVNSLILWESEVRRDGLRTATAAIGTRKNRFFKSCC
jgi:hypothetical protein